MSGGPWSADQQQEILNYCQTDVDPLGALLERQLVHIRQSPLGLGRALLRGRYSLALARMYQYRRADRRADARAAARPVGRDQGRAGPRHRQRLRRLRRPTFKAGLFRQYLRATASVGRRCHRATSISSARRSRP